MSSHSLAVTRRKVSTSLALVVFLLAIFSVSRVVLPKESPSILDRGERTRTRAISVAQAPPSLPDFDYDFETLVNNQLIFGQGQWVSGGVGNVAIRNGPGVNQTQTAKGEGGNAGSYATRPLDNNFYYTSNDTNVVWRAWGYVPSGGNNVTAISGILPVIFGPHQLGGITPLTTFLERKSSPTQLTGDALFHDRWYEYRVIVDFSIPGGLATLSYRDLTSGTGFQTDNVIKDVNLGLVPDALGRYGFSEVFIRNDGAGFIDNLHFDAPVATACAQPPPNMVAWWPADNNPNDIRGGNHGTLVGGVSYASGKAKEGFSFPSLSSTGSDRVALTSAPSANTFTIEGWVFANQHGPSGYRTIYADNTRGFWLKSGKLNWWWGGDRFVGDTTVSLGAWHHVALTYSQGTFTGYLDGAADGSSFFTGEFLPTGTGLGIGGHSNALHEDFDGLIDELAIYDRDLSPSEILAIFNAGSAGKCKCVPPPSGLVGWWPGDANANDIKSGNNGTLINGATFEANGKVGSAFRFTSSGPPPAQAFTSPTSQYVNVPTSPSLDVPRVTVDAWIKTTFLPPPLTPGPFAAVVLIVDKTGANSGHAGYQLFYRGQHPSNPGLTGTVEFLVGAGGPTFGRASGLTPIADGNWHHVAGTYDGLEIKVYVDGNLDVTAPYTAGILYDSPDSGPLSIGRRVWPGYPNGYFDGLIDEVEVFNRALQQQEIRGIFNAGSAGKCKPTPGTGIVIIRKNTVGGNDTFGYAAGGAGLTAFNITTTSGTGSQTFNNIAPGLKTITEAPPPSGWLFTNLVCSDPDGGTTVSGRTANIDLDPDETVVCTYTNTKCPAITLNPAGSLTTAVVNTPYNQTIVATGGCSSSFSYSVTSGALPAGFTLGANGVLSGTTTQPGGFTFTVTATDSCGCSKSQAYTLKVECPTVALSLFNTGVADNGSLLLSGATDPHYVLLNTSPVFPNARVLFPNQVTGYVPNSSASQWLGPNVTPVGQLDSPGGFYTYRTTFNVSCDPGTVVISGRWASDNESQILLNGSLTGFSNGANDFNVFTPFVITAGFGVGVNTLDFRVRNRLSSDGFTTATGLRVEMSGDVKCCPACATPPSGMVAWWPLDEPNGSTIVNDIAGINNQGKPKPGTALGNTSAPIAVLGQVAGAVNFDSNSLTIGPNIEVPNHTELNFGTGSLTVDAWVFIKPPQPSPFATTAVHPIVDKLLPANAAFTQGRGYAFYLVSSFMAGARLQFVMGDGGNLATYLGPNAPSVPYNTWTHVAVTINRGTGTAAFYVNGIPVPLSPPVPSMPAGVLTNTQPLLIGESRFPGRRQAFITIDELEMFRRALTTTEIQRIFNAGGAGKCKCLAASRDAITCGPNGSFIYTFTLTNLSNFTATGVNFSSSSGITVSPNSMTIPPLAPGATTNVTVTISGPGAVSGANVCFVAGLTGAFTASDIPSDTPTAREGSQLSITEEPRMVFPVPVNPGCRVELCITLPICPQTTSLTVNKIITTAPPPPAITPPSTAVFPVTVTCQPSGYNQTLNLTAAVPTQSFNNIPLNDTCTVTEGPLPPPFSNPVCAALGWSPPIYSPAQTITLSSTSPHTVSITNRFGCFTNCLTCAMPPPGMVAWWPMNLQANQVHDIAPLPGSTFDNLGAAQTYQPVNGYVGGPGFGALYFNNTPASVVVVPPQAELDFVNGDFSIDAWVSVVPGSSTEIQPIIDKFASPAGPGFAFYVRNQRLELNINGTTFTSTGPPMLTATNPLANSGPWNHVAVTIRRNPAQIIFYLNGGQVGIFTPLLITSVINPVPLWIGETRVLGGRRELAIDELEIFNRVLPQADLQQIFSAGAGGKCRLALP